MLNICKVKTEKEYLWDFQTWSLTLNKSLIWVEMSGLVLSSVYVICEWFADPRIPWSVQGILLIKSMLLVCLEIPCAVSLVQTCSPFTYLIIAQTSSQWMGCTEWLLVTPATSPGSQKTSRASCPTHLTVQKCTGKNFVLIVNLFNLTWSLIPPWCRYCH